MFESDTSPGQTGNVHNCHEHDKENVISLEC